MSELITNFIRSEGDLVDRTIKEIFRVSGVTPELLDSITPGWVSEAGEDKNLMREITEPLLSSCWPPAKNKKEANEFARTHRRYEREWFRQQYWEEGAPYDPFEAPTYGDDYKGMEFHLETTVDERHGRNADNSFDLACCVLCNALQPGEGDMEDKFKRVSAGVPLILSANSGGIFDKDTFFGAVFRLMAAAGAKQKLADRLESLKEADVTDGLPPDIAGLAGHPDDKAVSEFLLRQIRKRAMLGAKPVSPEEEVPAKASAEKTPSRRLKKPAPPSS